MQARLLFSAAQIDAQLDRLAQEIESFYDSQEPVIVLALLNGALWFAADLLRKLPRHFVLETARVSSYGGGQESSGQLDWRSPIPQVAGRRVLILDDVLDTGLTLKTVTEALLAQGARDVRSAVAVDKVPCRKVAFEADFVALVAEEQFLIGYGLDLDDMDRNLPDIMELV